MSEKEVLEMDPANVVYKHYVGMGTFDVTLKERPQPKPKPEPIPEPDYAIIKSAEFAKMDTAKIATRTYLGDGTWRVTLVPEEPKPKVWKPGDVVEQGLEYYQAVALCAKDPNLTYEHDPKGLYLVRYMKNGDVIAEYVSFATACDLYNEDRAHRRTEVTDGGHYNVLYKEAPPTSTPTYHGNLGPHGTVLDPQQFTPIPRKEKKMTFKITLGRVLIALALLCYPWNLYLMRSSAGFYDNAQHGHDKMEQLQPRTWALAFSPVTAPISGVIMIAQSTARPQANTARNAR
jgi:hypothetical protein